MNGPRLNITARFATFKRKLSEIYGKKYVYTAKALLLIHLCAFYLLGVLTAALIISLTGWHIFTAATAAKPNEGTPFTGQNLNAAQVSPLPTPTPTATKKPTPTPALTPIVSYKPFFDVTRLEAGEMTGILDNDYFCTCTKVD